MEGQFSQTAAFRRLRGAIPNYGFRHKFEIGIRCEQDALVFENAPTSSEYDAWCSDHKDDLERHVPYHRTSLDKRMVKHGSVIHVYVYERDFDDWSLYDVVMIWLGDETQPAVCLDRMWKKEGK